MKLNNGVVMSFGKFCGIIYGGPFREFDTTERRLVGIKMAKEINHPFDFSVPTEDFSVPDPKVLEQGLIYAFDSIASGKDVYVGCMGGIGRTGLFMAIATKCLWDWYESKGPLLEVSKQGPIKYVRLNYHPHAVETSKQREFVESFDTARVVQYISELVGEPQKKAQEPLTFWQWLSKLFGG